MKRLFTIILLLTCLTAVPLATQAMGCYTILADSYVDGNCVHKIWHQCCSGQPCYIIETTECY